ncbi:hypothetical protein N9V32_02610 [Candidatus Actinomarina sp.]|nr:hypothetical protein [Candidatus Actinomarina sp.]
MKFAHSSEQIFAEHLDLFGIEWLYEPISFPLKWGSGAIKMMFTPDFYIPSLDIFIEITTMNQNLITRKSKKIKKAKKLYPSKNFKLINEKEFYNFLEIDNIESVQETIAS